MTKISVIIPVYNVEQYLSRCLESVCGQTLKDIEIICINDCSTDNSLKILEQYKEKDNRIKIIELDKNCGVAGARNTGMKMTGGKYFAFVDADDYIEAEFLEKLYKKAERSNADVAYGQLVEIDCNNKIFVRTEADLLASIGNKLYASTDFKPAIYSSDLILSNNIKFPEGVILCEDMLFLGKVIVAAKKVVSAKDAKYFYIRRPDSGNSQYLTKVQIDSALPALKELAAIYKSIEPGSGRDFAYKNILNILWMFALKTDINDAKRCLAAFYEFYFEYPQKEQLDIFPALNRLLRLSADARVNKTMFLVNTYKSLNNKVNGQISAKIPIFLICDNNYAPYMAVMIASICHNTQSFIEFHVIGKGISEENQRKIESMKSGFSNFDIDYTTFDATASFNIPYLLLSRMTSSTFIRMALPDLYPDIKRALVMDVDMITLQDISKLWNQTLDEYIFAAALDTPLDAYYIFKDKMQVNVECKYANCGIMLINCEKWRQNKITEKCLDVEKEFRDKLNCADQDVINKIFLGNFKILDSKYNSLLGEEEDIVVRHFCWLRKPWFSRFNAEGNLIKNFDDWWHYAEMTPYYEELKIQYDSVSNNGSGHTAEDALRNYARMENIARIRNSIKIRGRSLV